MSTLVNSRTLKNQASKSTPQLLPTTMPNMQSGVHNNSAISLWQAQQQPYQQQIPASEYGPPKRREGAVSLINGNEVIRQFPQAANITKQRAQLFNAGQSAAAAPDRLPQLDSSKGALRKPNSILEIGERNDPEIFKMRSRQNHTQINTGDLPANQLNEYLSKQDRRGTKPVVPAVSQFLPSL